ncbi:MAG: hypothetical protein K2P68_12370 [Sphingomonas sp.]|nr:hypothetical protein [Sphingomonas sp.]
MSGYWIVVAIAFVVAVGSGLADRRRMRRTDLDRVGMIDWRTLQLVAIAVLLIGASLALKG